VWLVFGAVVFLRFIVPWEHMNPVRLGGFQFENGPRFRGRGSFSHSPVGPIPADLWRIHLEIAPKDENILRRYRWNGWQGVNQERPEVLATVREGDRVYTNVAVHLKGAAGSFRMYDDYKPALTLNFSKHADDQKFHGYKKISLNNSVQDHSFLCEALSRELFEAAGVPAPRADHVTLVINGRDLGLYVMTEGWGKPFLKRYFKDVSGNLYDSGFVQDVTGNLSVNSGDRREDHPGLLRLLAAAQVRNTEERWARLNEALDMERFTSFVAMEIMTCHWDGYALNRNNYRVFHDRTTDKMVFMPHGMDQMFGVHRASTSDPILPSMTGYLARQVFGTPQGRRMLFERIGELRTNVFIPEKMTARVRELSDKIRPTLAAYGEERHHDSRVEDLCRRIEERAHSISLQLGSPAEPIAFNTAGEARLTGWQPRVTSNHGGNIRFENEEVDGTKVLKIRMSRGGGTASWRCHAELESGAYRFEGLVRTSGAARGGGVRLRISGSRTGLVRAGEDEWTPISFRFRPRDPVVVLVCEFEGSEGEAWFDTESLRLVRE
jgi:hypothetical protein